MSQSWADAREAHRRSVREGITRAALALVRERGAAAVTMSELATRAGVSRATLYNHFPDLEHVLVAWVEQEVTAFLGDLSAQLEAVTDPLDRIETWVRFQSRYFAGEGHRAAAAGMDTGSLGPQVEQALQPVLAQVTAVVHEALASAEQQGRLRPGLDLDLHAELVVHLAAGTRGRLVSGALDPEAATAAVMGVVRRGLAP